MSLITKKNISNGVTWVAIKEANLYLCCGCPADTVKHLRKSGCINNVEVEGIMSQDGPNAILLSDTLIQNGQIANLAEFPILQMLYMQGMNLVDHPNYKKSKPILIGYEDQIKSQLDYASVGNHGLTSIDEIMEAGISLEGANKIISMKLHFSGGEMKHLHDLIATCTIGDSKVEMENGVYIHRTGINIFKISYKDESVIVDLNLKQDEHFIAPYELPFKKIVRDVFSITHTGEGNGWDEKRPCMASVIHFREKIYLVDAGPNILNNLSYLGIGLSEIDGIFLSHIHDDHFAGITELINVERKLNLYTTKLVRRTAEKKLKALMNSKIDLIDVAFNCIDLEFDFWNDVDGMEVKPIFSPHTVETNIFNFRIFDGEDFKTYTHLADSINFDEYKAIVGNSPKLFSTKDISRLEEIYLSKVNLKKIDVGGGIVHGHLTDYDSDSSDVLVVAHTTAPVETNKENLINVEFGDAHTLIRNDEFDFLKAKSTSFIRQYFDTIGENELSLLVQQKINSYTPNQQIIAEDDNQNKLMLILTGLVFFEDDVGNRQTMDSGNVIGYSKRYFRRELPKSYQAFSHVNCLEFDEEFINTFIKTNSLVEIFNERISTNTILRRTRLLGGILSNTVYNRISINSEILIVDEEGLLDKNLQSNIFIIVKGKVKIRYSKGFNLSVNEGEHFGGSNLLNAYRRKQNFIFSSKLKVLSIPIEQIEKVPQILWRLLELEQMRYQLSIFKSK